MKKTRGKSPGQGLDETRRLLYMAWLRQRTEKYELAGTLVNALAHHHPNLDDPDWSREKIADHVIGAIEDGNGPDLVWLRRQIQRLTEELGRKPG